MSDPVEIVMRARNDMPLVAETLAMIRAQDLPQKLIVFDNASTDGTLEEAASYADEVVDVPEGTYIPGRVLNTAMERTRGPVVVFVNSDCTPQNGRWLTALLAPFEDDGVAAAFGRQIPRPDCHPLFARDTEMTYGDGARQAAWRHCFSMASSAIRRSVWERMPFNEKIRYSEDIEWTWRARQAGGRILYARDSVVAHSHNYTWPQYRKRQFGEGHADAEIFKWDGWEASWPRYALLPYLRQIAGDVRYCLSRGDLIHAGEAPFLRSAQLLGRWSGFRAGLRSLEKPQ